MNTRASSRRAWFQLNEQQAARTGMLLLLLALPTAVQAQFTFTTNNGAITITRYTGPGGAVRIPSMTNGLPVTGIGDSAFFGDSGLSSVAIPDSATNIEASAFQGCSSLTNVTIGISVTSIAEWAFSFCPRLRAVYFQGNAPLFGGLSAFYGDSYATVYYLPGTTGWGTTFAARPAVL